jgi:hypothetical protein
MSVLLQPTCLPFVANSELNRQLNYVVPRFAYSCVDVKCGGYCGRRLHPQIIVRFIFNCVDLIWLNILLQTKEMWEHSIHIWTFNFQRLQTVPNASFSHFCCCFLSLEKISFLKSDRSICWATITLFLRIFSGLTTSIVQSFCSPTFLLNYVTLFLY